MGTRVAIESWPRAVEEGLGPHWPGNSGTEASWSGQEIALELSGKLVHFVTSQNVSGARSSALAEQARLIK